LPELLSATILVATGCGRETVVTPSEQHTQLTATVGEHHVTADVEGEAGLHLYVPNRAIVTSQWSSFLITTSGVYFGTNEIVEHRWIAISDGFPVALHITHDKFSAQCGTNQVTTTPNKSLQATAAASSS
jgi:hypothetical protein